MLDLAFGCQLFPLKKNKEEERQEWVRGGVRKRERLSGEDWVINYRSSSWAANLTP